MDVLVEEILRAGKTDDASRLHRLDDLKSLVLLVAENVDLLAMNLVKDGANTIRLDAEAGSDRVDVFVAALDEDFGSSPGFAGRLSPSCEE